MKIKKQVRQKSYNFNRNRKRLNKQRRATGKVKCPEIKDYWNDKKTAATNARQMGISADPNKTIAIPNAREDRLKMVKMLNGFVEEECKPRQFVPRKGFVVERLIEEATAPREPQLRLPKGHINELVYFMDKYQLNYSKMVMDRRNHYQYTWKQFRSKIRKFMSIPEQFNEYLATKNIKPEEFNWVELCPDDD